MINNVFDNKSVSITQPLYIRTKVPENIQKILPKKALITFSNIVTQYVLRNNDWKIAFYLTCGVTLPAYIVDTKVDSFVFFQCPAGAPNAAGTIEELRALGVHTFFFYGSCGILESAIEGADIIIPTFAVRDEGTSYHYKAASETIEVKSSTRLMVICDELKIPYTPVMTWTTDAFYRETINNMKARHHDGCATVEMECSAIAAIAHFYNIEIYQAFYGADVLSTTNWDRSKLSMYYTDNVENNIGYIYQILQRL
jgi:nucleoside phosphorylase